MALRCRSIVTRVLAFGMVVGWAFSSLAQDVLLSPAAEATRSFKFSAADELLLDEVQLGCFNYLWNEVGSPAGLVRDRFTTKVSSTAAVGFQLSSLPIGVERGWVTRKAAEERAVTILRSLVNGNNNRKFGVILHFVDPDTGALDPEAPQVQASTVDHALLQSGAIPAAMYFGGEVRQLTDRLIAEANWQAFSQQPDGLLSFGWRSEQAGTLEGAGGLRPWVWHVTGAEETLCYFHAVAAPNDQHAIEPSVHYKLKRKLGQHNDMSPYAVSWNGSMFTYFFDHCWIDYRRYRADNPANFGGEGPRVHWFENSRRAFQVHRQRCIEKQSEHATLGPNRWGLGPCIGLKAGRKTSYLVQDLLPNHSGLDLWRGGTVAPYVTGAAMPFMPAESIAALHEIKELKDANGKPLVWRSPSDGGYGFLDSFNLDQMYAPNEYIGIDVGPMLLLIENARSGLIWKLFHQHPHVDRAAERLGWKQR